RLPLVVPAAGPPGRRHRRPRRLRVERPGPPRRHPSLARRHRPRAGGPARALRLAHPFPRRRRPGDGAAAGPRWMLLGDAAGLVDPLTREGIYFALRSGEWAAETTAREPGQAARGYAARLRDEVYPELVRAARACDGFFDAPFLALMLDAVARSPRIAAVLVDLVAGRQPYRGLRRRLLRTREWGYAWRLARLRLGFGRRAGRDGGPSRRATRRARGGRP